MGSVEIERKFIVLTVPPALLQGAMEKRLRQGYLCVEADVEVRLRESEGRSTMTVKSGRVGLVRTEVELELEPHQFEALWPLTQGRRLEKKRASIPWEGVTIELDTFSGALDGLQLAEVEFVSVAAASAFVPPSWFGEEVTSRNEFRNRALATRGRVEPPGTPSC